MMEYLLLCLNCSLSSEVVKPLPTTQVSYKDFMRKVLNTVQCLLLWLLLLLNTHRSLGFLPSLMGELGSRWESSGGNSLPWASSHARSSLSFRLLARSTNSMNMVQVSLQACYSRCPWCPSLRYVPWHFHLLYSNVMSSERISVTILFKCHFEHITLYKETCPIFLQPYPKSEDLPLTSNSTSLGQRWVRKVMWI